MVNLLSEEKPGVLLSGRELTTFTEKLSNLSSDELSAIYAKLAKDSADLISYSKILGKKKKGGVRNQETDSGEQ